MPKLRIRDMVKWTPEVAYAVGLIVTDGHLSLSGRHVVMRSSDRDLLETYKQCLGITTCAIGTTYKNGYSSRPSYRVQHGDTTLYEWLQGIGIPQNKTHAIGELSVPNKVFVDFLRGHLDGDGSITTYIDRWNTFKNPKYVYERLWVRFLSASKSHMAWLQEKIKETIGVSGHLNENFPIDRKKVPMYSLKFGKKDSVKILERLYYSPDVPCLKRKRKIAERFLST